MPVGNPSNTWNPRDMLRRVPQGYRYLLVAAALLALGWLLLRAVGVSLRRDETWARIQREKVLRVGMEASFPPFEVVDADGRFSGFDVDLAAALAERWGARLECVNVHLDGLYDALQEKKFDLIISALPYDRTLTRDVGYSTSYFNAGQVLLARSDDLRIQSLNDLAGGRVAVELGAEGHQLARQWNRDKGWAVQILAAREPKEALALLLAGEAEALICDRITAVTYMAQHPGALHLAGPPLTDEPYVIAVRKDSPVLLEQVNLALAEWRANGFLEELQRRWLGAGG